MNLENNPLIIEKKTYPYLDFFKALGLFCVILAHVNAPKAISFIRSFDVPFLVMISATLAFLNDKNEKYFSYVWKRVKRLLFPTWIYLTFCTFVFVLLKIKTPIEMLPAFLLQKYQFGFVWIIGLYFVIALIIPFLRKMLANWHEWNMIKKSVFTILLIGVGIIFELICAKTNLYSHKFLEYTFFYIIPYGIVSILGIIAIKVQWKWLFIFSIIFLIFAFIDGIIIYNLYGIWIMPNSYNQPARFYYLTFSLSVGFLLYALFRDKNFNFFENPIIVFLSRHSLWIYLWHSFTNVIVYKFTKIWYLSYIMTLTLSCLIVFIQNSLISCIHSENKTIKEIIKIFRG